MTEILLVEDDDTIASGLRYALEQEGYALTLAATVADALEALKQHSFTLLLIDLGLPDGSGFDVCRAARRAGDAAVIFLTAHDDELSTVMGLDMGGRRLRLQALPHPGAAKPHPGGAPPQRRHRRVHPARWHPH